MSTYAERRFEALKQKLQARTQRDGKALPGFKQNVAAIRAEMDTLQGRIDNEGDQTDGQ